MKEKCELTLQEETRELALQNGEIAVVVLRRLNYMIDVGFKRKLRSHSGSKGMSIIKRIKTASRKKKKITLRERERAWEVCMAELIDNVLVLSILRLIKFDDIGD